MIKTTMREGWCMIRYDTTRQRWYVLDEHDDGVLMADLAE